MVDQFWGRETVGANAGGQSGIILRNVAFSGEKYAIKEIIIKSLFAGVQNYAVGIVSPALAGGAIVQVTTNPLREGGLATLAEIRSFSGSSVMVTSEMLFALTLAQDEMLHFKLNDPAVITDDAHFAIESFAFNVAFEAAFRWNEFPA